MTTEKKSKLEVRVKPKGAGIYIKQSSGTLASLSGYDLIESPHVVYTLASKNMYLSTPDRLIMEERRALPVFCYLTKEGLEPIEP